MARTGDRPDQARTRLARGAVVEAARTLFLERGYGATTIDAISDLAGVPPATVYRLFKSKHGILKSLLDIAIVGDEDDVPMAERTQVRALLADGDPCEQLAGFVRNAASVNARVGPLYRILASAATVDSDAAELFAELNRQRQRGQRLIARSLARARVLRPGLRGRDAADVIHALLSPEVYRLLVVDRQWKVERYEQWLTALLIQQLLTEATPR